MRNKLVLTIFSVIAILAIAVSPAYAITNGEPDENRHPYVGLMVALDEDGNPLWRCSGTLISPWLFLTAGHCTEDPAESAVIWFDEGPILTDPNYVSVAAGGEGCADPDVTGYPCEGDATGTVYTHPDYDPNAFYLHDLGVVVLDEPVYMDEYGALPEEGLLDQYANKRGLNKVTFTAVGYGLQKSFPDAASWKDEALRVRLVAYPKLIQLNTPWVGTASVLLTNNAHTGGTCFGDSGGPVFLDDTNVIVGVTSFGLNSTCAGTGGVYRIDQADDLNWLYSEFGQYL